MTTPKPTFRVMKNGYDRFAVDEAIENYASLVDQLERKVIAYEQQFQDYNRQLELLKNRYLELEKSYDAERQAADNIARLSLREANQIIDTAQKNADMIIHEAILTARLILTDLSRLYNDADQVKATTTKQLEDLLNQLEQFQMPRMPDLRWLEDAEEKMR